MSVITIYIMSVYYITTVYMFHIFGRMWDTIWKGAGGGCQGRRTITIPAECLQHCSQCSHWCFIILGLNISTFLLIHICQLWMGLERVCARYKTHRTGDGLTSLHYSPIFIICVCSDLSRCEGWWVKQIACYLRHLRGGGLVTVLRSIYGCITRPGVGGGSASFSDERRWKSLCCVQSPSSHAVSRQRRPPVFSLALVGMRSTRCTHAAVCSHLHAVCSYCSVGAEIRTVYHQDPDCPHPPSVFCALFLGF